MNPNNNCTFSGRIASELEFRKTGSEEFQAIFSIAVRRNYKSKKTGKYESDFFQVRYSGVNRMAYMHNFRCGDSVNVIGPIKTESYEDGDGKKNYVTFIEADSICWAPSTQRKEAAMNEEEEDERTVLSLILEGEEESQKPSYVDSDGISSLELSLGSLLSI